MWWFSLIKKSAVKNNNKFLKRGGYRENEKTQQSKQVSSQ
jgi:hypothetical protein